MTEHESVPETNRPHLQRLIDYLLREHKQGRPRHEIVKDPYVKEFDPDSLDEALEHVDRDMVLRAL